MHARLRAQRQAVWQNTGVYVRSALPGWVRECTEMRGDELYLVRRSGKQRIDRGDWLLQDLDGEPVQYPDVDFQKQYEMVG